MTLAGPTSRCEGTWETSSLSRPLIQWTGASKCVPVCSPVLMLLRIAIEQPVPQTVSLAVEGPSVPVIRQLPDCHDNETFERHTACWPSMGTSFVRTNGALLTLCYAERTL